MNTEELLEYDDLGDALREGRALRPARGYRLLLAQGDLNFQSRRVSDPMPLGRQLLEAGTLDPREGYSLFAILPSGDFEDVRLNEPFDLREHGAERFVAFLTDRDFKLTLNDGELRWGKPVISGAVLYGLAKPGEWGRRFPRGPRRRRSPDRAWRADRSDRAWHRAVYHRAADVRDHRQFAAAHGERPHGHVRAGRPARFPGPARAERRLLDDLSARGVDAARGRTRG